MKAAGRRVLLLFRAVRDGGRAHLARQCAARWKEQLGGAPAGAQSYWQGRFAVCAFVGGFFGIERPKNNWGVAPNPTRELRPLTPPRDSVGRFIILCPRVYRFSRVFIPFNRPCPLTSVKK